ncbi:MAG: response regulator [Pseudomonadales bacterium]|jgi:CheY-like chemotaxis protein
MSEAKILIVDDVQENLILLDFALRPFDVTVVKAASGFAAEAACLEDEFVVIILDVHMPERNGIETAEIIRKTEHNALTPIIFLTADTTEAELPRSAYQSGAVDVMFKPLEAVRLRAKVAVFLDLFVERQKTLNLMSALRESQADQIAQEKFRAVSSLIGSMSHSLNNQLCIAEGYASLVMDEATETQLPHLNKVLEAIRESTNMLQKVQGFVGGRSESAATTTTLKEIFSEFQEALLAFAREGSTFTVNLSEALAELEAPTRLPNVLMFPLVQFVSELAIDREVATHTTFDVDLASPGQDQVFQLKMSTQGLEVDEPLLKTVNDFFGSADVTAQERGIAVAGVKSMVDSMNGALEMREISDGFEIELKVPFAQLIQRLGG